MTACPVCGANMIQGKCCRFPICTYTSSVAHTDPLADLILFDLETTGLNRQTDKIIELGAIHIQNGEIVDTFSSLANPGFHPGGAPIKLTAQITKLTGITDEMLEDQPCEEEAVRSFIQWCGSCSVFGGHNVAGFDIPFLKFAAKRAGVTFNPEYTMDTLRLAKAYEMKKFAYVPDYKQTSLAAWCGFTYNAHRALDDVQANFKILKQLINKFGAVPEKL